MADGATYPFLTKIVEKAAGAVFDREELFQELWEEVIDEAIFAPRAIAPGSRAAVSAEAADAARRRSPNLDKEGYPFVWPRFLDERPFPVVCATLLGPVASSPFAKHNRTFTVVQHTPVYSGNPYSSTLTYCSQDGCDDDDHCVSATDTLAVGGLFESFAYGGVPSVPSSNNDTAWRADETNKTVAVLAGGPSTPSSSPGRSAPAPSPAGT